MLHRFYKRKTQKRKHQRKRITEIKQTFSTLLRGDGGGEFSCIM